MKANINLRFILLVIIIGFISCNMYQDRITYYFKAIGSYKGQSELRSLYTHSLLEDEQTNNIQICKSSSKDYYQTIKQGEDIQTVITELESDHTNIMIQFDSYHIKTVEGFNATVKKYYDIGYSVDNSGTLIYYGEYLFGSNCLIDNLIGMDEKVTITQGYRHSAQQLTLKIMASYLSESYVLGLANINLYQAKCGDNAEINPIISKTECVCKEGYQIWNMSEVQFDSQGKQSSIYYQKCHK